MNFKIISSKKALSGKRVLVRVSLNVPFIYGSIGALYRGRLFSNAKTILYLKKRGATIFLIGHRGRPKGRRVSSLSLRPLIKPLTRILNSRVIFLKNPLSSDSLKRARSLPKGSIALFENIRFFSGEEKNDLVFAKKLASFGDLYVNEAFADSGNKHASIVLLPRLMESYAGFQFVKEVKELSRFRKNYKKPRVVLIGGVKIETKLGVIEELLRGGGDILLGGHVANIALFQKSGFSLKLSKNEMKASLSLKKIIKTSKNIFLPLDLVVREGSGVKIKPAFHVTLKDSIIDIGPETSDFFIKKLLKAETVLWNGPMGVIEKRDGERATKKIAEALAKARSKRIVGGGETVAYLEKIRLSKHFSFVSTGGGAMLKFIGEGTLLGIKAIEIRKN